MYKVGDEVIEKSSGQKAKIISMKEMAEMCYELQFFDGARKGFKALRFAREITPANTVCTGQERDSAHKPGTSQPSLFPAQGG